MTATLQTSRRSQRLFGMPASAAAEGLGRGAGVRGDIWLGEDSSLNYQVKPDFQPTHINPVGASLS
jgi:hypothetical protein